LLLIANAQDGVQLAWPKQLYPTLAAAGIEVAA